MSDEKKRLRIRSEDTRTTVAYSKTELERVVKRYGAVGFTSGENYENGAAFVTFVLPDSPANQAPRIPVRIPIEVVRVYYILNPTHVGRKAAYIREAWPQGWARAERVAWRNLVLWVTAALSSAQLGLQTISEALFAHTVVGENGERMIQVIERAQAQLGPGVRALLAPPAEEV